MPNHPDPNSLNLIIQRLFQLRNHFRVGMPENLVVLEQRILEAHLGQNSEITNDFDLYYAVGQTLTRAKGSLTMSELSRALKVPLSRATHIMDMLVSNGYAERLADPQDRRIVRVQLTPTGSEIYRTIDDFLVERCERYFSRFTPDERQTFFSLMNKALDTIEQEAQ